MEGFLPWDALWHEARLGIYRPIAGLPSLSMVLLRPRNCAHALWLAFLYYKTYNVNV